MSLLVSGWVALDDVETPFARNEGALGGSATCAALAGAFFTDVRLLAAIGEDFPEEHRRTLAGANLDLAGLTVTGPETSRWGARYHYDMNTRDTLYTVLGVNADYVPRLPPGWEDTTSAFLAAGDPILQRDLIANLPGAKATMVDTIKFFIDGALDELRETMRQATFVSINDSEARMITGTPSVARAGRKLVADGTDGVIIKLGEYGAAFISMGDYFVAPGYPLEEVFDPTGAGDAFAGGFMGYLDSVDSLSTVEIRRAVVYGSTVASFCVEGMGPERLLSLTRPEIEARYREFRMLTHFEVGE